MFETINTVVMSEHPFDLLAHVTPSIQSGIPVKAFGRWKRRTAVYIWAQREFNRSGSGASGCHQELDLVTGNMLAKSCQPCCRAIQGNSIHRRHHVSGMQARLFGWVIRRYVSDKYRFFEG